MSGIDALPPLREVIAAHGLSAKKSFGQNFLLDLNLTRRIARTAGPLEGRTVVEIGPGPGGLTRALLLEGAQHVLALEADQRLAAALGALADAAEGRFTLWQGDALAADEPVLLASQGLPAPAIIAANLPYNIATLLLAKWLDADPWPRWFDRLTLMFQKEVAERLNAGPGTESYGRLSIMAQWRCSVRIAFDVHPSAFTPPPKVTSSVVRLDVLDQPKYPAPRNALVAVTAAAFGQRRKMLRSALRTLMPEPEAVLADAGIAPTLRAEDLPLEAFCALARAHASRLSGATKPA